MANPILAGGVSGLEVTLHTKNRSIPIVPQLKEIEIIQDADKQVMYGYIDMLEYDNLVDSLPIVGEEFITIKYNVDDREEVELEFVVHNITNYSREGNNTHAYRLNFVSPEYFYLMTLTVDEPHSDYVSTTVASIMKDKVGTPKDVVVEKTNTTQHIVFPGMNVKDSLDYLILRAESADNRDSYYKMFETFKGFQFVSVGHLIKQDPVLTLTNLNTNYRDNDVIIERPYNVIGYTILQNAATSLSASNGGYKNTVLAFDPLLKKYQYNDLDYFDAAESGQIAMVEKNPINSKDFKNLAGMSGALDYAFITSLSDKARPNADQTEENASNIEKYFGNRQMSRVHMADIIISVDIPLTSILNVGDMVDFDLGRETASRKDSDGNAIYLSGKYFIQKVSHLLEPSKGITSLELRRSGLPEKV